MQHLRIAFFGGRILGFKCLDILHEYSDRLEILCVISNKNDGEDGSDWNPPLLPKASAYGFPVLRPDSLKDQKIIEFFKQKQVNLILNAFCNRIVPGAVLDIPELGAINFHYGQLPYYRGRFIVNHIILNNEERTCATAHYMTEEIDAGDIIYEEFVPVLPDDTAKSLYFRCTEAATSLFRKIIESLLAGKPLPRRQQKGEGRYYPFEEPNHCMIDLNWPVEKIERFVRAMTFEPISYPRLHLGQKMYRVVQDSTE